MLNYIRSVIRCFTTQRGDYSSRTNCKTFWGFSLVLTGLYVLLFTIAYCLSRYYSVFWGSVIFFASLVLLIEFIPTTVAALVRRFHDRNHSGYWVIPCFLVPVIGWIAGAIYAFFLPGQAQENNYPRQIDKVRPFWKHKRFWLLHAAAVLVALTQFPLSPVTITERSHYITQPRTPDGKVDYAKAMYEKMESLYKNPEENGVRQLYQLYGAKIIDDVPEDKSWKAACEQLQLDPNLKPRYNKIPDFRDYLAENKIDVKTLKFDKAEFIRQNPDFTDEELDPDKNADYSDYQESFYNFYEQTLSSGPAWTSAQHPVASQWLDDHAVELDAWAKAIRMPVFQCPFKFESPIILQNLNFGTVKYVTTHVFNMRIRCSLGDGKIDQALDDMETLLLLAQHYKKCSNSLLASLINNIFVQTFLNSVKTALRTPGFCESMTDEQWERLNNLTSQKCVADLECVLDGQFIAIYDYIQYIFKRNGQNGTFGNAIMCNFLGVCCNVSEIFPFYYLLIDENKYREQLYADRQRIQDAFLEKDRAIRNQKFDKLCESLPVHEYIRYSNWLTINRRTYSTAYCVFNPTENSFWSIICITDKALSIQKLVQVAIAIERYRVKEGKYPESLEQLTDKYWDEKQQGSIRFDPCSGKDTLGYRLNAQSKEDWERELKQGQEKDPEYRHEFDDYSFPVWRPFILYSVGLNLTDENGEILSLTDEKGDIIF